MESKQTKQEDRQPEHIQGLTRWVRRYVAHRQGGPFLVFHTVSICLWIVIIVLVYLTGYFHRQDNAFGRWSCGVLLGLTLLFVIVWSIPWWGGKWSDRWGEKLYAGDGAVQPVQEKQKKARWPMALAVVLLLSCIFASAHLERAGYFPPEYRQPISVIYVLPLFVFLGLYQPVEVQVKSPLMGIWLILYVLHALWVLLDWWPISAISRRHDLFIATFGYGFVTAVVVFIYSRYAFYRLKKTARMNPTMEKRFRS